MKLASYLATRDGIQGIANRSIRFRFGGSFFRDGQASHTEVVFEPGDGVDHLMPDGTTEPIDGKYWCASAVAAEELPSWSKKRAGKRGGVRFKRIAVMKSDSWDVQPYHRDPVSAANWFRLHEGDGYDWELALGFVFWPVLLFRKPTAIHWSCSETAAAAGNYTHPEYYHPALMHSLVTPP